MKTIVKIVAFRGNSGNSGGDGGGDGALNSNHRGTGRGKTAGDLGEWVPRVRLGIPKYTNPLVNTNFGSGKKIVLTKFRVK